MAKRPRDPFEVRLTKDAKQQLALDLSRALDDALAARTAREVEVEYWHTLYEQGRTRGAKNEPWADAADLTSYLGTQYVDVMRAEIMRTVMTEPVWTVEGYGQAAAKAPFVEEFHQWQMELERFQEQFARGVHLSLIEPRGVLELYEERTRRPVRKVIKAKLEQGEDGRVLTDEQGKPILERGPDSRYIEALEPDTPFAETAVDSWELVARGPRARAIPYRDYLQLPGHAGQRSEVWGHAKRFWRRLDELEELAKAKVYDAEAVKELGSDDERATAMTLAGGAISVASKDGSRQAEKELWELLIEREIGKEPLRWYVVTLHKDKQQILRIQHDDIGQARFFSLVPFPRPASTEGYSYVGHKLITVIEEHTAWRNMLADRASLQLQAPIKVQQGALWDPDSEPIGPKAVITVRDMREIEPMVFPDVTGPAIERLRDTERTGERLAGINDAAAGVTSRDQRTLGEVRLITAQSLGRVAEAVKNIQETLEEIGQVRHLMWRRALAEMGEQGMEVPERVTQALELRGADVTQYLPNKRLTATMLEGAFRFKPRGSVETADKDQQRYDFNQWLQAMTQMMALNPMIAAILRTPQAAKALVEQGIRLYNVQDKQAFLGSEAMAAMQAAMMPMAQPSPSLNGPMSGSGLPSQGLPGMPAAAAGLGVPFPFNPGQGIPPSSQYFSVS